MTKPTLSRGRFASRKISVLLGAALVSALALTVGCLERPVVAQKPNTSNVFVNQIQNKAIDKIDLLFVIDNSASMADKQGILEVAVPNMVTRLVQPDCVVRNDAGEVTSRSPSKADPTPTDPSARSCTTGALEFNPINDIHIGIVTSSLGGHGSTSCSDPTKNDNDKGYLLPLAPPVTGPNARPNLPTPGNKGFLAWFPTDASQGETDATKLADDFKAQVVATGEHGCGFEAPLEAWYRFLVDPSPPAGFALDSGNQASSTGVDQAVLDQRRNFLRSDSLVAIVVLTDENDCSAMEGGPYYPLAGFGWLVARTVNSQGAAYNLPIATSKCNDNPNDPCCFTCLVSSTPSACKDASFINECAGKPTKAPEDDRANARCFQNKRRFGVDFLYPTDRYVDGLKNAEIVDTQTGEKHFNALLAGVDGNAPRDPSFVFFAGIVGVPWQDISTAASLTDAKTLKYLTAAELAGEPESNGALTRVTIEGASAPVDRWSVILGDPGLAVGSKSCLEDPENPLCGKLPVPPKDPFMLEQIEPRTLGAPNPVVPTETILNYDAATFNKINGHEINNAALNSADNLPQNDDLQYACTFPLFEYGVTDTNPDGDIKKDCAADDPACDCGDETTTAGKKRPLCRKNAGDPAGTTQYWGKAYPGLRILEVLKNFGDNSIVASICPKVSDPTATASFGYNAAVGAIVDRLAEKLGGQCLPRGLTVDAATSEVPCTLVEALDPAIGQVDCTANGRKPIDDKIKPAVVKQLLATLQCKTEKECELFTMCEIIQISKNSPDTECLTAPKGGEEQFATAGYCYIDPAQGLGSEELVASCPSTQRRLLRFVGPDTPKKDSVTFVACTADAASSVSGAAPSTGGTTAQGGSN